jgi:HPt (histidine-containing phosphotransfer) domain-containing protein
MMGDDALYVHLLRMFRDRERNFAERFRAARSRGDAATAMRMAHDLKSVSGSLAVSSVHQAARALERACIDGGQDDRIEALLQDVDRPLVPVIAQLDRL